MTVRLTPRLCRAARALADMEQNDLASASNVARSTIAAFEVKDETARLSRRINLMLIGAFERAGLQFISENGGGPGVRFRDPVGN